MAQTDTHTDRQTDRQTLEFLELLSEPKKTYRYHLKYLEWQAKCKTRSSCNLLVEKKVRPIVKSTTEDGDNSDSTTETMLDDQTTNVEVTTVITDKVKPQNTNEDTTIVVRTDIIDSTSKIIIEDDTTHTTGNVDRTAIIEDIQTDDDDRTTKIENVQTDNGNMTITTMGIEKSLTNRPRNRSNNRQIGTEVTIKNADIKNENDKRDEDDNNSAGNSSSEIIFSTIEDQHALKSSETIPYLNAEIQKTTQAVEEDQSIATTYRTFQQAKAWLKRQLKMHNSTHPDDITTSPPTISRILKGPKQLEHEKFSKISHSFKIFLNDFVNVISSDVMEKLSQKGSTFQLKSDKEYPASSGDYGSNVHRGYDEDDDGSGTEETELPEEDQKTTSSSKEDYTDYSSNVLRGKK